VVAVCDTYKGNLNKAKDQVITKGATRRRRITDYRDILNDPTIDVVVISTPSTALSHGHGGAQGR